MKGGILCVSVSPYTKHLRFFSDNPKGEILCGSTKTTWFSLPQSLLSSLIFIFGIHTPKEKR